MKNLMLIICMALWISCNDENKAAGEFSVSGNISNAPDQNIFLEEIYFGNKPPVVIDTTKLINGKFVLSGIAPEQGLYRLRLEKGNGYIFINDEDKITASINATGQNLLAADFKTPCNISLIKFVTTVDSLQKQLNALSEELSSSKQLNPSDSGRQLVEKSFLAANKDYKDFILTYIDTTKSPVIALFALGYTQDMEPASIDKAITHAGTRFSSHLALNEIINHYKLQQAENNAKAAAPVENTLAPEINLPDTVGKLFALSSLKGKYVLVDFWASWCGPCRLENPNVVTAYNKFKSTNFTILGVSLDKEKSAWLQAIKEDGLTWNHVSDLKFWNSMVVPLYNIEGIPYNVLVDPTGKIIASNLRGTDLENKLAQVLKN